jgi:probable phosphoglycerate mutase
MDAEIYLVRHGETEWNAQGRFQGCLDSPLTPNGREQARQFGMLLPGHWMDIVASPCTSVLSVAHVKLRKSSRNTFPLPLQSVSLASAKSRSVLGTGLRIKISTRAGPACCTAPTAFNWYFRAPNGEAYDQAVNRVVTWLAEVQGTVGFARSDRALDP